MQKIVEVRPPGYTGPERLKELNKLLKEGYKVKHITPVRLTDLGDTFYDYVIEK